MTQGSLDQAIRMLQGVPFFAGLSNQEMEPLASACRLRSYRRSEVIFHRDDPADTMHIVQGGQVRIVLHSTKGDEIVLALFHPRDFFGELSLLDGLPRSATAVAMEPTVTLTLGRAEFLHILATSPRMTREVIDALAARLRHTNILLGDSIFLGVGARLAKRLLELAEAQKGARDQDAVRVTQAELATLVGASRETVNKELRALEARGAVRLSRGRVHILHRESLRPPGNW